MFIVHSIGPCWHSNFLSEIILALPQGTYLSVNIDPIYTTTRETQNIGNLTYKQHQSNLKQHLQTPLKFICASQMGAVMVEIMYSMALGHNDSTVTSCLSNFNLFENVFYLIIIIIFHWLCAM